MKKLAFLACVCMALVFSSCHRPQHTYNAAVTEYHFQQHDNEVAVKAVLNSLNSFWEGDYTWKGDVDWTDVKAEARFSMESVLAIKNNFDNKLAQYFEDGDYFIYTLTRVEDNTVLHKYKFTKDGAEDIYSIK